MSASMNGTRPPTRAARAGNSEAKSERAASPPGLLRIFLNGFAGFSGFSGFGFFLASSIPRAENFPLES